MARTYRVPKPVRVGQIRKDPDHRVVSRRCTVVAVDGTHATVQRGREPYATLTRIRLDRLERFPFWDENGTDEDGGGR